MFGFLRPDKRIAIYQRAYCRCCQHQRQHYGITSLPFLTYESAFAYLMTLDVTATDLKILGGQRCCIPRLRAPSSDAVDSEIGRFAASLSILLSSIKFDDEIRDRHSFLARTLRRLTAKNSRMAVDYFSSLDADFSKTLGAIIKDHLQIEEVAESITIAEYAEPTTKAFGYVFGLIGELPGLSEYRSTFSSVGEKVGAATVAYDAAVDWKRDKRRGEFNPVRNDAQAVSALAYSQSCLRDASDLCQRVFGFTCRSSQVLLGVYNRVYRVGKARWPKLRAFIDAACPLPTPQREGVVLYEVCPCGTTGCPCCDMGCFYCLSCTCAIICCGGGARRR